MKLTLAILLTTTLAAAAPAPKISPQAQSQLDALQAAYAHLHSLQYSGTFSGTLTANAKQQSFHTAFDTAFLPGQFRHTPTPSTDGSADISFGSTGAFAYLLIAGQKGAAYLSLAPAVAARQIADHTGQLAASMWRIDPALALCVAPDAADSLADARTIDTAPDTSLDGRTYTTLLFDAPNIHTTLLIDPQTHLLRRVSTTIPPRPGAPAAAPFGTMICDYPTTTLNAPIHQSFDWTPPANAQQLLQPSDVAKLLQGRPAPDLTFTCLDGTRITLSALKGHVILLDFWATWCPPCVAELPTLDKLAHDNQSAGLKTFALDAAEPPDTVKNFLAEKNLTLPVAIDPGPAAQAYAAEALPETILIAKDGTIQNVFIGSSPDTQSQLQSALKKALAQP